MLNDLEQIEERINSVFPDLNTKIHKPLLGNRFLKIKKTTNVNAIIRFEDDVPVIYTGNPGTGIYLAFGLLGALMMKLFHQKAINELKNNLFDELKKEGFIQLK